MGNRVRAGDRLVQGQGSFVVRTIFENQQQFQAAGQVAFGFQARGQFFGKQFQGFLQRRAFGKRRRKLAGSAGNSAGLVGQDGMFGTSFGGVVEQSAVFA